MDSVEIKAGKKAGTQLVIVKGTKTGLTKEQAVKSLGDKASRFVVKAWKEGGEDDEEEDKEEAS